MKKRNLLILVASLALCAVLAIAGCASSGENGASTTESAATESSEADTTEQVNVRVAALKGPTAIGMVKMMDDAESAGENSTYSFDIYASPDEVTPKIVQGEVDIAAVPANLAAVLYANTDGSVQTIAINTLGVLYICDKDGSVHDVSDLAGKTIYASGKGATPEYALNYVLRQNGLDPDKDVNIQWQSEHSECVAALANDPSAVAMLPQPFVSVAQSKDSSINVAIDLTEAWESAGGESDNGQLITGVAVVRTEFAQEHPEAVQAFLDSYKESVDYVNNDVSDAAQLVGKYDIVDASVAEKAIPECNIVFIDGDQMKTDLSGYLNVLFEQNANAVGGSLPGDDFYYGAA